MSHDDRHRKPPSPQTGRTITGRPPMRGQATFVVPPPPRVDGSATPPGVTHTVPAPARVSAEPPTRSDGAGGTMLAPPLATMVTPRRPSVVATAGPEFVEFGRSAPVIRTAARGSRPCDDVATEDTLWRAGEDASFVPPPQGDDEVDHDLALVRVQSKLFGATDELVKIGRFVVLEKLGQGAMGVVYQAYDPKLDRKVAIKLVDMTSFGSEVGDAQARLEREAQAAATLSHPNVVTVYDVGQHRGAVFLAMEFVPGQSLTAWMQGTEHAWRDVVGMFVPIGRGLAAAHQAGLVHRDFKPDNVLVGDDGRPRVADFGLARPTEGWSARTVQRQLDADASGRNHPARLISGDGLATTGEVCGTPAYMAPEQFAGVAVGAHSDQFGFCVSLHEALFGYRPFQGENVTELAVAVLEGKREALPARHQVPKAIVQVVMRGLDHDPARRFGNMDELVSALDRVLHRRRRGLVAGAVAGFTAFGLGVGYQAANAQRTDPCAEADDGLAEVWNAATKREILQASEQRGLSARYSGIETALDGYAANWVANRRDACEATRVEGAQSEFDMGLRYACLDRARGRIRVAVEELSSPSIELIARIPAILTPLDECDNIERLAIYRDRHKHVDASSTEVAAALERGEELRTRLRLHAAFAPGERESLARELIDLARTSHAPPVFENAGLLALGDAAMGRAAPDEAEKLFAEALSSAVSSTEDRVATTMWRQAKAALELKKFDSARLYSLQSLAFAARHPDPDRQAELQAGAKIVLGEIALKKGEYAEARDHFKPAVEALEATKNTGEEGNLRGHAHTVLGQAYRYLGDLDNTAKEFEIGLDYIADDPTVPPEQLAGRHGDLGIIEYNLADYEGAARNLSRTIAILAEHHEEHPMMAMAYSELGAAQRELGKLDEARANLDKGLAMSEKLLGPDHMQVTGPLEDLAELALGRGDYDEGLVLMQRSAAIMAKALPPEHPMHVWPRVTQAKLYTAKGEFAESQRVLGPAMQRVVADDADPMMRGEVEFEMARALAPEKPDVARALAQACLSRLPDHEGAQELRESLEALLNGPVLRADAGEPTHGLAG